MVSWDTADVFQADPKNAAEYFLAQELNSGTPQIHSPVEVNGHKFDTTCTFYSMSDFNKPPLIINVWSHSRHTSELLIPTSHYPWMVHFAPFQAYFFLSDCVESVAASTLSIHLTDTKLWGAGAAQPARPQQISDALLDWCVKAAANMT